MTRSYLDRLSGNIAQVIPYDYPFNYSDMHNQIIHHATGDILCLMNNDISVFQKDWLREMIGHLTRQGVGAVGAKLLWPNDMVQHGGVVVGVDGLAAHTGNYYNRVDHGYFDINISAREQSAVTAACMVLRKSDFISVGGFDPKLFPIAFNDVDLCLRLRQKGLKIIWTPYAELYHLESASRGKDLLPSQSARSKREQLNFIQRWTERGFCDPYYNPNLSLDYLSGPYQGIRLSPKKIEGRFNK